MAAENLGSWRWRRKGRRIARRGIETAELVGEHDGGDVGWNRIRARAGACFDTLDSGAQRIRKLTLRTRIALVATARSPIRTLDALEYSIDIFAVSLGFIVAPALMSPPRALAVGALGDGSARGRDREFLCNSLDAANVANRHDMVDGEIIVTVAR